MRQPLNGVDSFSAKVIKDDVIFIEINICIFHLFKNSNHFTMFWASCTDRAEMETQTHAFRYHI